ncbi:Metabotropic glutamate receptor 8 [Blattella germanica]|nr:Metabotropic glutamate receptor 8 [Blattella germanica]
MTQRLHRDNTPFEGQLQFVSDAVMAFAHAFRDMHKELCYGRPGLCDAMKPIKGTELLKYLRKVTFEGLSGDKFRFDPNGDGPARYNIIHFKQMSQGKYQWVKIRHPTDETQCLTCSEGTVPDPSRIRCREIPEVFLRPESGWAIGAMSLSSTGILITLFVCGVFMRHNDTPVVRASGRELSYVLLTGILLCYCVTFALVLRPTDVVCGIQRIFNANKRTAKKLQFISPKSQLFICSFLVGVQDNHLVCSSHIDASYMIAFGYPIVLIVVCTVYAVLTRKIPEAFNESKHIGFTMYTTCVIWLAFVPLYFGTGNHVPLRITSMSVTISLSASVTLACLFSPKLYIILVHPERNNRYSSRSPAVQGTAQTGSMMAAVVCSNQTRPPFQTALPQQSGSSQGLDSGLQSDGKLLTPLKGIDLELREDIVHQSQRKLQTCLLVNRSTQTVLLATSNSNNCTNNHQPAQSPQQPVAKLSTTCHIINSSSNGPISVPQSQQKQVKDVQL